MLNTKQSLLLTATILTLQFPISANASHEMYKNTSHKHNHVSDHKKHGAHHHHHHAEMKMQNCARGYVISGNGNPVSDSKGNLVYTKWANDHSECGCYEKASAKQAYHTYHVYFPFNGAMLDKHSKSIVAEAAASAHAKGEKVHFTLGGHSDSSGKASYNLKLSERRAQAVADELVRHGIKAQHIKIEAFGEGELVVKTGDNVREAKNRVVTIALHGM